MTIRFAAAFVCAALAITASPALADSRLAYHDSRAIFVAEATGQSRELVRQPAGTMRGLAWRPDASQIAYAMIDSTGSSELWVVDADTGLHRKILALPHFVIQSLDWSSRGQLTFAASKLWEQALACVCGLYLATDVYVVDDDGTDLLAVTADGRSSEPAWSPDGRQLAFSSARSGISQIYIAKPEILAPARAISDAEHMAEQPAWSRDGTVAYLADPFPSGTLDLDYHESEIWLGDPSGARPSPLNEKATGYGLGVVWSPDARRLAYTKARGTTVLDLVSHQTTRLSNGEYPQWSRDGLLAVMRSNGSQPYRSLLVVDSDTHAEITIHEDDYEVSNDYRWS